MLGQWSSSKSNGRVVGEENELNGFEMNQNDELETHTGEDFADSAWGITLVIGGLVGTVILLGAIALVTVAILLWSWTIVFG